MAKTPAILVTGGPTRAYLDRVRFLSNVSTGEVAYLTCRELVRRGLRVTAVIGPSPFPYERLGMERLERVETTVEMHRAVLDACRRRSFSHGVFSAAVLDFAPRRTLDRKVTSRGEWTLRLAPTPKIIDDVARRHPEIRRIGFKLEWRKDRDPVRVGRRLLREKRLAALCLNYLSEIGRGDHPALLFADGGEPARARTKRDIARWIARFVANDFKASASRTTTR